LRIRDEFGGEAGQLITRPGHVALDSYRFVNHRFCVRCALTTLRANVRTPLA
jgi:hypothetical protein